MIPLALLLAQMGPVTPVRPIEKGTGLILADGDGEAAVLAPIERAFGALERGDAAAIRAELAPGGGGVTAVGATGVRRRSWDEWLAAFAPDNHRRQERFVGRPAVEVDGDLAMVWGEYRFTLDGVADHCGVDHVSLVRIAGAWRIANLAWTQRPCG